MKDAYYFSHDSNARHDPKIAAMRSVYGVEGYGWFWILVEMMREQEGYKLDMRPKYAFHAFASQMQCEADKAQQFIMDCINEFGLFMSDGEFFWSPSLSRRMDKRDERSRQARKAARIRWSDNPASDKGFDDEEMQAHSEYDADASKKDALKERKGKESKRKEIKIKYADFVSMTEKEYQKLVDQYGPDLTKEMVSVLDNYKGSKNKKYASDYRAILSWVVDKVVGEKRPGASKNKFDSKGFLDLLEEDNARDDKT